MPADNLDHLCVNTLRTLAMDAVEKAQSGHPGMPMGMADAAYVLWTKFLKHNPQNPDWFDRDRFILSAGHGSVLLYGLLHLTGYNLSIDELKNFRQLHSLTPGHPEGTLTPGVETTTGPLGQGLATGIGMAMAEAFMAARFNKENFKIIDHYTYGIVSDGDLMEGVSHEAASLAGHLKLGKIIYLYDSNKISIDGSTDLSFSDDTKKRFESYGWHTQQVDGHDRDAIEEAIRKAQNTTDKPSLIECKTIIGFGSPNKEGTASSHGAPLGEDEIKLTKKRLGWKFEEKFHVPDDVYRQMNFIEKGKTLEDSWDILFKEYENEYQDDAVYFRAFIENDWSFNWEEVLPDFETDEKGMASRKASGAVLQELAKVIPNLVGGSADLTGSNNTDLKGKEIFSAENHGGQYVHYGVREHAMAAALNGMMLHKGVIAYGGTFLVFSDYNKPAIRIAALTNIPSIFVFTHDSIGLGEDGPTHQPVEHLAALRATPNVTVIRPADANETAYAWKAAIENKTGPTLLILTRQSLPTLDRSIYNEASGLERGAYIIKDAANGKPEVIVIASGSEVQLALEAARELENENIATRVVSMPSWELFQKQDREYIEKVLPRELTARISVEAASTFGWERWTGTQGVNIGLNRFGESAPYKDVYRDLGITSERIVDEVKKLVQ
ncbi:MAG TPA: transketolase [Balneolaceae bacterium]|nr:transketolase [Balneolaceae bacterium]